MSDKHKHIAFLCGHFKREKDVSHDTLVKLGWQRHDYTEEERSRSKRFYYPEFVDFCYAKSMDEGCVRYTRLVNECITVTSIKGWKNQEQRRVLPPFIVKQITFYFMPQNMVLYSIHVVQQVSSFDDCSTLMFTLRYIEGFRENRYSEFCRVAIDPIARVFGLLKGHELYGDYTPLVENGNKLRLFQIVHAADGSLADEDVKRRQLYRLATFMPIANDADYVENSLFAEHQQQEIEHNSVAVFPEWTAFSLLDTVTILASDSEEQTTNWVRSYFGHIYIHALFQKACLFDFNNRFKQVLNSGSRVKETSLVGEYEAFERNCCFNKISYNFLPLLFAESITNSLEINSEMQQLYRIMDKERSRNEEISRKRMNSLLLYISFLTLFSAIWDACSMLNEMFSFEAHFKSSYLGFRMVVLILALVVGCGLLYLYRRQRKS